MRKNTVTPTHTEAIGKTKVSILSTANPVLVYISPALIIISRPDDLAQSKYQVSYRSRHDSAGREYIAKLRTFLRSEGSMLTEWIAR